MTEEDKGKTVEIISVDRVDECRAIQVGDLGEIELIEYELIYILLKTGLAKGSIYTPNAEQLKVI